MITVLNAQPVNLNSKLLLTAQRASELLGSEYKNYITQPWLGDELTISALFPQWIIKEYEKDVNNVTVIPIVKNYMRWLLSQDYGYGAQLNWENIRVPLYINSIFLEALADFYFPDADFSQEPLKTILPNIRRFLIRADQHYFNIKGTPEAIRYLICSLLGFNLSDISVFTGSYVMMEIKIKSSQQTTFEPFKPFISQYVIPAGISVNYSNF
tara:strand:+ start:106 stop:741 length:636 start_codon:yes stop_codon:yes gene_type:complete